MERCITSGIEKKSVVNVCDGAKLGYVTDIEFDCAEGRITAFIAGECSSLGFSKGEHLRIPWCNVKCIGEDTILVEVPPSECRRAACTEDKSKKKGFFK